VLLLTACDRSAPTTTDRVERVELAITGMHCDSCVKAIEAGVADLEGVRSCRVSLDAKRGTINVSDPAAIPAVTAKIARMGFGVEVVSGP
jgi:Cu+-exporting ATPase